MGGIQFPPLNKKAMLYKNDVIFELSRFPKEIEAIEKFFHGKFPVKVKYPPDRIVPSRLKHNRLPDKPASIAIPLRSTVNTNTGSETWRYVENIITDDRGNKKYLPTHFILEGSRFLERTDIELIFFLLRKSRFCLVGDNFKPNTRAKFTFEDLVTEAEKKMEKRKIQQKVDSLLLGELALTEERQRDIAKGYFMDIEDKELVQIQAMLFDKIFSTKDGPDKFFDRINAEDEIKTRASIYKITKERKLVTFNVNNKSWYWSVPGGKDVFI